MRFLPSFFLLLLAATASARNMIVEFTLPEGEVANMKVDGKDHSKKLESGPHRIGLREQQKATLELIREFRYPVQFHPAEVKDIAAAAKGEGGIVPQTPAHFETSNPGWEISVVAYGGTNIITLVGKMTYTRAELEQAVHGEGAGPIVREFTDKNGKKKEQLLSPNVGKSAIIHTTSTNFQLYATPGKSYEIPGRRDGKIVKIKMVCAYQD